jgi:hypothetical protein
MVVQKPARTPSFQSLFTYISMETDEPTNAESNPVEVAIP